MHVIVQLALSVLCYVGARMVLYTVEHSEVREWDWPNMSLGKPVTDSPGFFGWLMSDSLVQIQDIFLAFIIINWLGVSFSARSVRATAEAEAAR